jgi:hypothetical protein
MTRHLTPTLLADLTWTGDDAARDRQARPTPAALVVKGYVVDPADLSALQYLLESRPVPMAPATREAPRP